MNISNNKNLNILDLPNEILFIVVNKLNIGRVVYSLIDIDERFAQMVLDPLYIHNLDMTDVTMKSYFDYSFSIDDQLLSRICETILPKIHDHVNKLTIEQHSMERILFTFNYPQLYSLSLVNFQEEILLRYLTDHSILRDLLTEQITHLNIDIQNETKSPYERLSSIFEWILLKSKRLIHLNFCQLFPHRKTSICVYELRDRFTWSSSLTQMKINVSTFTDCLYLLEGRLPHLSKLIINVKDFAYKHRRAHIDVKKKLPALKYFSFTLDDYEDQYDDHIIPLLRRMINLEELILYLLVMRDDSTYINGIQLYDDILIYMPRLNKFTFSINTGILSETDMKLHFSSNEYIQSSFIGRGYGKVSSYVYSDLMRNIGTCHIYSLPYQFERFFNLNNSFHFQDGIFDQVQRLTMIDKRPFEHQFFELTSHYFPFLKELNIDNHEPQEDKQYSSTLIRFPHLIRLNLDQAHLDYAEQLLLTKNTHLSCLLDLFITYESLTILTNNFTNDPTYLNCTQLKKLDIMDPFVQPKTFHTYFPSL